LVRQSTSWLQKISRKSFSSWGEIANIVFDDADMDQAVKGADQGDFFSSRTVVRGRIPSFFCTTRSMTGLSKQMVAMVKSAKIGNRRILRRNIGPMPQNSSSRRCSTISKLPSLTAQPGAIGGKCPENRRVCQSNFVEPTIFTNVTNNMRIAQEEVFGPVLSVIRFKDVEEAIRIANDINYGLAAGNLEQIVWRGRVYVSQRVKAGTVWVTPIATQVTPPRSRLQAERHRS